MTLTAHVHGGYASYDGQHDWRQADYDALKLVQTLKGKPINGYASLKKIDGNWATFRTDTPQPAFDLWGAWAGQKVRELVPAGALLVPIPTSTCTAFGNDPKGRKLADAVRQFAPKCAVVDAIAWRQVLKKASEGGPRDPDELFANMKLRAMFPDREVILIDDVVTGGGHLIAAARALRNAGHKVRHAVCVAHTVKSPPADMFAIEPWDLEYNPFAAW